MSPVLFQTTSSQLLALLEVQQEGVVLKAVLDEVNEHEHLDEIPAGKVVPWTTEVAF